MTWVADSIIDPLHLHPGNIRPNLISELMRTDMLFTVGFQVPAPPVRDQPTLLDELCLVDVSGADVVPFFVAHLPLNGDLGP